MQNLHIFSGVFHVNRRKCSVLGEERAHDAPCEDA
jgi:hypothetical protein